MTRNNRIIFEGAIYHIFQRANNKEHIFNQPEHKEFLLELIEGCNKIYDFQLLAYVIMNNHYHLLIKTNKTPINNIMFSINNVFGKYLNRELERTGHAFEGRYGSRLVDSEAYLIWLLRYIHRNPVRANICLNADEYKWSSHMFYKYGINEFVNTNFILKIMSHDKAGAIRRYRRLVDIDEENTINSDFENIKLKFNLTESELQYEKPKEHTTANEIITNIKSMEEILESLNLDLKTKELLKNGSRKHSITACKIKFIQEAIKNKHTYSDIGRFLNTSQSAISNILAYYRIS